MKEPASLAGTATILVLAVLAVCISPAADLPPTAAHHFHGIIPSQGIAPAARPKSAPAQATESRAHDGIGSLKLVRVLLC